MYIYILHPKIYPSFSILGGGDDSIMQQLMGGKKRFRKPTVKMIVDLAFASNVRFLDDHELYLDNVDLYRV